MKTRRSILEAPTWKEVLHITSVDEEHLRQGGGAARITRQHRKGRLTARERIELLIDPGTTFFELGLYAAYGLYEEWGGAPAAGVITGFGRIQDNLYMVIANDATVKAGAFFPMTVKKVLVDVDAESA